MHGWPQRRRNSGHTIDLRWFFIVGCLYIFEVLSYDNSVSILLKAVAAIVLLGGCSALVAFLMRPKKEPPA